jgi:formamidopyrimidine-DNA glycosylase
MPELPEVETIKNGLEFLIGKKVSNYFRSNFKLRVENTQNYQLLIGAKVTAIRRRARYLIIDFDCKSSLIIHLGMSGRLVIKKQSAILKHDHFILYFGSDLCLVFNDPRRFGFVDLIKNKYFGKYSGKYSGKDSGNYKIFAKLGPEPMGKEFNAKYLVEKIKNKKGNIKNVMMDNNIVVGIGNIYINESLFLAKILPTTPANCLNLEQIKALISAIKITIKKAIKMGGSSINDYVDAKGDQGFFQNNFQIYGRNNKKCLICNHIISKIVQNGRSSFYCSECQK